MRSSIIILFIPLYILAQPPEVITGQIGMTFGASHYFGDLNNKPEFNQPYFFVGAFYRKYLNEYIAWRVNLIYGQLGYNQANSSSAQQRIQNLNFKTDIIETSVQGDFNFYKYLPGSKKYLFTPYLTLGVGLFYFNPYTYLNGKKYYLREYKTEGQKRPYLPLGICVPMGVGVKWNISRHFDLGIEASYRFTSTYYLDDVHNKYIGSHQFTNPIAQALQDRSIGQVVGVAGKQRGSIAVTDSYIFLGVHIVYNLLYRQYCPTPMEDGF